MKAETDYVLVTWGKALRDEKDYPKRTIYRRVRGNLFTPIFFTAYTDPSWAKFVTHWPLVTVTLAELKRKYPMKGKRWLTEKEVFAIAL